MPDPLAEYQISEKAQAALLILAMGYRLGLVIPSGNGYDISRPQDQIYDMVTEFIEAVKAEPDKDFALQAIMYDHWMRNKPIAIAWAPDRDESLRAVEVNCYAIATS